MFGIYSEKPSQTGLILCESRNFLWNGIFSTIHYKDTKTKRNIFLVSNIISNLAFAIAFEIVGSMSFSHCWNQFAELWTVYLNMKDVSFMFFWLAVCCRYYRFLLSQVCLIHAVLNEVGGGHSIYPISSKSHLGKCWRTKDSSLNFIYNKGRRGKDHDTPHCINSKDPECFISHAHALACTGNIVGLN